MDTDKNKLRRDESRRDSIIQPRVARNELPWICDAMEYNLERVEFVHAGYRCNPVGDVCKSLEIWTGVPSTAAARLKILWVRATTLLGAPANAEISVGVENYLGRIPKVVRCAANPGLIDSIPLGLLPRGRVPKSSIENRQSKI
jgi:hypothetical protein